jgi:hypothetical protein
MVHGEEGHPEILRILLEPSERREGNVLVGGGDGLHHAVLRGEVGVQKELVLGGGHPDDQPALGLGATGAGADPAHDRLVGKSVQRRRLDVEDL